MGGSKGSRGVLEIAPNDMIRIKVAATAEQSTSRALDIHAAGVKPIE